MDMKHGLKIGDKVEIYDVSSGFVKMVPPGVYEIAGSYSSHPFIKNKNGTELILTGHSEWKWNKYEEYDDTWI